MFSTDFIFRQQENLIDNQTCQAGFRPLCNKILLFFPRSLRNSNNEAVSLLDQFEGLKAIHFVGEVGSGRAPDSRVYEGEANQQNHDGVFRQGPLQIWTENSIWINFFLMGYTDVSGSSNLKS